MEYNGGIIRIQSQHPKFLSLLQSLDSQGTYSNTIHQQNCTFIKFQENPNLIISTGYLISKFGQAINSYNINIIKQHIKFSLILQDDKEINLNLICLNFDDWIAEKLNNCYIEIELGFIMYFEFPNINIVQQIPKYCSSLLTQGQEVLTINQSPFLKGNVMQKQYCRKAYVSQLFTNQNQSKQLIMLGIVSQVGQEGGGIFNSKGEYVGILLQNIKIGRLNNRYFTFCVNWVVINSIFNKNTPQLSPSYFNAEIINQILNVTKYISQGAGQFGSGILVNDLQNQQSYILTANHVLSDNLKGSKILIGEEQYEALILEDTLNNMDFSIGKAKNYISQGLNIEDDVIFSEVPVVGSIVYAVGYLYTLFQYKPCISKGSVIKIIYDQFNQMISIVTDCFIHNGYSGGGLYNQYGQLLGIISFNICHSIEGVICDLSYITPIFPFQTVFQDLVQQRNLTQTSKDKLKQEIKLASEIRTLCTLRELPQIGYIPKL
ncbi:unnamed protein product [Paramecium pentaurelia]|uniref:Uncharacterized protein n=1 Tax=Paramecium pentaurelia TaxID=43138 RepID=A0A8S1W7T5_9CILI|nr:unnamed protein product [Paramecium pentaurelia]